MNKITRNLNLKTLLIFALAAFFPLESIAQQVHTYVDRDSIRVGETFVYSIVLEGNYSLLSYPDQNTFEGDLEVLSRRRYQVTSRKDSLVYNLQYFDVEDLVIPSQGIDLNVAGNDTTVYTSRVPLFFKTTLAEEDEEFRPLKPIFDFARAWWLYVLLFLLTVLIAWLAYYYYKRYQEKAKATPPPDFVPESFNNPLLALKNTISQLEEEIPQDTPEQNERFYIQIGDAIRLYLKQVYKFNALEMTSGEIINHLQSENVSYDLLKSVRKVLNEADLVKFANFNPDIEQKRSAHKTAVNFYETAEVIDKDRIDYLRYQHEENQKEALEEHKKSVQEYYNEL